MKWTHGLAALMGLAGGVLSAAAPADKSSVKPNKISLPSGPGSIEGLGESFEPQLNTGTSTYGVKIAVPPGRAGLEPSVRLTYNSGLGNSFVGVGWSMDFLSIKRQTDKGFPSYDEGDTFLFQGEELVPLNDGTFRCENESGFQRFERDDVDGDGADEWVITERNGTRHILGQYVSANGRWSAVLTPGGDPTPEARFHRTFCWMVNKTIDVHDNIIEYDYWPGESSTDGVLYPNRIWWAESGGRSHEIRFVYEERADIFDDYRPTFRTRLKHRLRRLEVLSSSNLVRAYDLRYNDTDDGGMEAHGVSLLTSVRQYDRGGSVNYLPPLRFTYAALRLSTAEAELITEFPDLDLADGNGDVQIADVNGDGLPDIFANRRSDLPRVQRVCLNRGPLTPGGVPRFKPAEVVDTSTDAPSIGEGGTSLTDWDGDGLTDVVQIGSQQPWGKEVRVWKNRSSLEVNDITTSALGFQERDRNVPEDVNGADAGFSFADAATRQIDLNFDKIPDFLTTVRNGIFIGFRAWIRDPSDGRWKQPSSDFVAPFDFGHSFDDGAGGSNPRVHLADMNGDRLLDLVQIEAESFGDFHVHYWPYRGFGQWGSRESMEFAVGQARPARAWTPEDFYLQDFTADGLTDIIYMVGSGDQSALSLWVNVGGTKWARREDKGNLPRYAPRDSSAPTVFRTADLNGNGTTDLIWRNTAIGQDRYDWLELMPGTKANLLTRIDNSLGKNTRIEYGSSTDDMVRAQETGHPWTTKTPFPVQVVRRLITTCGLDLNGDGEEDRSIAELQYRDAYYDALEREFRGFAFAQRIDYGDDFRLGDDGTLTQAPGWNTNGTPTGQVSGPTSVTRYRFLTGAPDRQDNDGYDTPLPPADALRDEWTLAGGREEEILKGRQVWEEKVDPWVLHSQVEGAGFDQGARAAALGGSNRLTRDEFVYTRARQEWNVRRLYRPSEAIEWRTDQDQDGVVDSAVVTSVPVPVGRFGSQGLFVGQGVGKSVSFAFVSRVETEVIEANGVLAPMFTAQAPELAGRLPVVRSPVVTRQTLDYDDFGNETLVFDEGVVGGAADDERRTTTSYALGGQAKDRWIIGLPDTIEVTDENGVFVSRTKHYYDGPAFVGLGSGQVGARGLLHRTQEFKDAATAIEASRTRYDDHGNPVELRDPIGNIRRIAYDAEFQIYPVTETIVVGNGNPDLVVTATYHTGFGTVTTSTDFNGNRTDYDYDSFARLVRIIRPRDTREKPTLAFEYEPADPTRAEVYRYAADGALTMAQGDSRSASRVLTRQREEAEGSEFITASFTDGCGKKLATVEEGEVGGTWLVKGATSYNLRGGAQSTWQPYQVLSNGPPSFAALWTEAGRPPATDGILRSNEPASATVVAVNHFHDPVGREIRTVQPPETWQNGAPRRFTAVHYLPFEERHFDEEDTVLNSLHAQTPMVHHKDGLGRLVGVDEVVRTTNDGEPGPLAVWSTRYLYDLNDQLRRITDSQGNVKTMEFDGLKRMTGMNDPDRGVMTYVYDDASNLLETVDAKGQRIVYTYDGANRIQSEDYQDGGPRVKDVEYFYDAPVGGGLAVGEAAPATGKNAKGQLAYVRDFSGETHFSYDERARVEWEIKRIPDRLTGFLVNFRTRFDYDSADRLRTLTYPDNDQLQHAYNSRNLLSRLFGAVAGDIVSGITYQPSGQLATIGYGNGVGTRYTYDPRLRLNTLRTAKPTITPEFVAFDYTFDGASNITRIDDKRNLVGQPQAVERFNTQAFTYDSLYRLTRAEYPDLNGAAAARFIDYRYDRIGNMLRQTSDIDHTEKGLPVANLGAMESGGGADGRSNRIGRPTGAPPGPHALTRISNPESQISDRQYDYDANGNMTLIDGLACSWDFKDRLVGVENAEMRAEYTYDYTDRRITKKVWPKAAPAVDAQVTHYINKFFELREGDSPIKYVWNGDTRVARVTATLSPGQRTQHLRLRQGWNLVCIAVGGTQPALDATANPTIPAAVFWSPTTPGNGYSAITATTPVPAGSSAWVFSTTDQTVLLTGSAPPTSPPTLTGQGQFVGNYLAEPIDLASAFPADSWIARFTPTPAPGQWKHRLPESLGVPVEVSDLPAKLAPGEAVWTDLGVGGEVRVSDSSLSVRYYHQDHLGSSSVVSDQAGGLVEEAANYAFGHKRKSYNPNSILPEYYGYTQKERDRESHLHYFESRFLASGMGRFIRVDPLITLLQPQGPSLEQPQELNLYSLCANNPIKYRDPSGGYLESAIDVASLGLGIASITNWNKDTSLGEKSLDVLGVAADTIALALPLVPGGAGALIKAARLANKADNAVDGSRAAKTAERTTVLGENMAQRVLPYAEKTGGRTLPFGATKADWDAMTPKQRWKLNDGALRTRIKEGDSFQYIGQDPFRNPLDRQRFDLTGSELLRLNERGIPYQSVSPQQVQSVIGKP